MPLRLDNPTALPTGASENKSFQPRFKIDLATSPMPETKQPERLAPRARSAEGDCLLVATDKTVKNFFDPGRFASRSSLAVA